MSIEKRIFERLFKEDKTELATQKIELGVADEISKALSSAKTTVKQLKDSNSNLKSADSKLVLDIKTAIKQADKIAIQDDKLKSSASKEAMRIAGILEKAEKAAKDLGVNQNSISGYNELDKLYSDIENEASQSFTWSNLETLVRF